MTTLKKTGRANAAARRPEKPVNISPEQMYIVGEHWLSDLEFFKDELSFLRNLIDKYLMWLIDDKHIEDTRIMVSRLKEMENQRLQVEVRIREHFKHIQEIIENPFSHDLQSFREEHEYLENRMAKYSKGFREMKRNVFKHTEMIMESEKAMHLLKA